MSQPLAHHEDPYPPRSQRLRAAAAATAEALQAALAEAHRYMGPRDRTVAEVRGHLRRRGVAVKVIDACVQELSEQGYLDDARFARRFAEDRRALDAWGNERIRTRLLVLGIDEELVGAVVAGRDPSDELDAAVQLVCRRLGGAPRDERDRQRAFGLLLRRGYAVDLAYDAVRRAERAA